MIRAEPDIKVKFHMKNKRNTRRVGSLKYILNTGRTTEQGVGLESGKTSKEYYDNVAVAFLNREDMAELGLEENAPVKVSTESGSVVVRCRKGELDRGSVFMPLGPWASLVVGAETEGTGMSRAKGIEAEVSRTEEELTTLDRMLDILRGSR